jgi:hypothetical protein
MKQHDKSLSIFQMMEECALDAEHGIPFWEAVQRIPDPRKADALERMRKAACSTVTYFWDTNGERAMPGMIRKAVTLEQASYSIKKTKPIMEPIC